MNIVVCDDEQLYVDKLNRILKEIFIAKNISVTIKSFTSGKDCTEYLLNHDTDIVFLDIFLADSMGTEIAMDLRLAGKTFKLIFLTTSNEFAAESFQAKASYYLLKPPTHASILQALNNADVFKVDELISIDVGSDTIHLNPHNIIAVEVIDKYCYIYTVNGTIKKYCPFKIFSEKLVQPFFMQVNRSVIVNFNHVDRLDDNCFVLKNGLNVQIKTRGSKAIRDQYIQWLFANI